MRWSPAELERLWILAEGGSLDERSRQRLHAILEDERALDIVLDQLETDALLRWHHGGVVPAGKRRLKRGYFSLVAAAAILVAGFLGALWLRGEEEPEVARTWEIRVARHTAVEPLGTDRLRLTHGELQVRSIARVERPLIIETPHGVAQAAGTTFYVSTHEPQKEDRTMKSAWTRILVVSGVVSMTNAFGSVTAQQDELIEARDGRAPEKVVVTSSNAFGFDVLRRLGATTPDQNLFFSPYSIASVLTMATEGASGATARQLAHALHWPVDANAIGEGDAWLDRMLARIQSGHRAMNERFEKQAKDPEQKALRDRLQRLEKEIAPLAARAQALQSSRDWRAYRTVASEMNALIAEHKSVAMNLETHHLDVANGLWAERTKTFDPAFLQTLREVYARARVESADFKGDPEGERRAINQWVAGRTQGRIPELLGPGDVARDTRMVLLNTIFLKAEWLKPFEKTRTKPAPFTLANEETIDVPLMHGPGREDVSYGAFHGDGTRFRTPHLVPAAPGAERPQTYPGGDGFQLLSMPYRGRALEMLVLLPQRVDGLESLSMLVSEANVERWLTQLEPRETTVYLPRFEGRSRFLLRDTLRALGVQLAFDMERADFSRMVHVDDGEPPLYLSELIHEAFVKIDEEGTEAAAATAAIMAPGAAVQAPSLVPFVPVFRADHPFLYLIRDRETGVILFVGRYVRP